MSDTRLWHPFADMHAVRHAELVIDRGEGAWVWDVDGHRYLDGTASLWCVNVGHGRREIADAVAEQMRSLASYSTFGAFANEPALERWPSGWPRTRRSTTRGSSSARAAATRSTPPRSSPAATSRHRPARARPPHRPHAGLPRHARAGHVDRRHPGQPRGHGDRWIPHDLAGPARLPRRRSRPSSRPSAPAAWPPSSSSRSSAPAACTAAPGLRRGVAELCARARRAVRRRRGHLRLRAPRDVVRGRALRRAARPLASPRASRAATCRSAASSSRGRVAEPFWEPGGTGSATARRTPGTRRAARRRWRTSTC